MKYLLILALVGFGAANHEIAVGKPLPIEKEALMGLMDVIIKGYNEQRLNIVANDAVDLILGQVSNFMSEQEMDPAFLPDINLGFEHRPVLITYRGDLNFTNGYVKQMSSIHRSGDAVVTFGLFTATFNIPIGFEALTASYDYQSLLMFIRRSGSVEGKISDIHANAEIRINLLRMEAELTAFEFDAGSISVRFSGNNLTDWIVNIFLDVATNILQNTVVQTVETVMRVILEQIVGMISGIPGLIP